MSDGSSDVCCTGLAGNGDAPRPRPKALPARLNVVDVVGAGGVGGLEQLVEGAERATELLLPAIPFRPLVAAGLGPGGDLVGRRHVELHPGLGQDRKSVVKGKRGSVRVESGGRRTLKKKNKKTQ